MGIYLVNPDVMNRVRALAFGLLLVGVVGCGAFGIEAVQRAKDEGVPPSHIVALDDNAAVGTRVSGTDLEVVFVYRDAAGELQGDAIVQMGSGLGVGWNTFLFGSAAPGVTRVTSTVPGGRGGH
jgi:hypothetical protein